ncbi:putative Ig domain-containing protein [Simplicispira piscis]
MQKIFKFIATASVAVLTACGGGGGSPGDSSLPYSISVKAAKTQLPLNIANERAGIGAYSPFTTTLYVEAREGSAPIPGGKEIFGCNVAGGLESGALYYLDGKDEHMVEVDDGMGGKIKVPGAYRNIVLDSNSGGNSFHFHAGDKAGTARIVCTVTNPADKLVSSASVDIVVGAATGKPASVTGTAQAPGYLGTSTNTFNLPKSVAISAKVMDDANQPAPDPVAANLQVSIRPFGASAGSRLLQGGQSGSTIQVKTIGGEGLFAISSGPSAGVILLELTSDRFDNDVSNGIQDPVMQLMAIGVHKAIRTVPLAITDTEITVTNGMAFSYALTAQGGVPPYMWTSSGLPTGLNLSADGVISGTPTASKGTYNVVVTVTDYTDVPLTKNVKIKVEGDLAIDGCDSDVSKPCALPGGKVGEQYSHTLSFSIGDPAIPVVWTVTGNLPPGLALAADGTISGTPTAKGTFTFIVTATRGSLVVRRQVTIVVG